MIIALFLGLVAAIIPAVTGGTAMTVMTGSMQPNLPPGHIAVYYRVDPDRLKVGDIIAYQPAGNTTNGIPITHRIVAVESAAGHVSQLVVKGDANRFPDRPLDPGQVVGRMAYYIPYAGLLRVASFHLNLGWLQSLASAALLGYGTVLIIRDVRKKRRARRPRQSGATDHARV